jgi:glutamate racemase
MKTAPSLTYPPSPLAPILVIDSGLGGLTVARALRRRLPQERLIYFGDTARVPYGTKSARTITACVGQIVQYLERYQPKHVVVACNSASAVALPALREQFPGLSISGVVEPGARAAAKAAGKVASPTIAVIATPATIRSRAYERAIARRRSRCTIIQKATPLLVPLIEDGRRAEDPLVRLCLEQYLQPLALHRPRVLVLGCTHYPILRAPIQALMGRECAVVDSAESCAEDVAGQLASAGLLRPEMADVLDPQPPIRLFASDESPRMAELAQHFLGEPIAEARMVSPDRLMAPSRPRSSRPAATAPRRIQESARLSA